MRPDLLFFPLGFSGTTSERSLVSAEIFAALSRYAGSCCSRWPYSFTVAPQPLAVITIASTPPPSIIGHQASISARMSSRPASCSFRSSGLVLVQVETQRSATAGARRLDERYAVPVEYARRRRVDRRRKRGLHAAREHQHAARVARRGPCAGRCAMPRNSVFQTFRDKKLHCSAETQQQRKQSGPRQNRGQDRSLESLPRTAPDLPLHDFTADVCQAPVLHARRTGGFAGAAGQAAVQMQARARRRRHALEHLLDEVDATAGPVQFVAEKLVCRAGCVAEAAVHALAQDRVRLLASVCLCGLAILLW